MSEQKYITLAPAPGRRVRKPGSRALLREAGERVELGSHWVRLIQAGDVYEVQPPPVAAETPKTKGVK